jgi:hypothetical protein
MIPNIQPQLEEEFPDIPRLYISRLMKEIPELDNIKQVLQNEILQINNIESSTWIMDYFKAFPCSLGVDCNDTFCLYYHFKGERRRIHKYYEYSANLCSSAGSCFLETCKSAHNENEVLYHPDIYQKSTCPYSTTSEGCPNESLCPFLHNFSYEEQLISKFQEALDQNDQVKRVSNNVHSEIMRKMEEIKDLSEKSTCSCNEIVSYIWVPCGHPACFRCKSMDNCKICQTEGECFKINYN